MAKTLQEILGPRNLMQLVNRKEEERAAGGAISKATEAKTKDRREAAEYLQGAILASLGEIAGLARLAARGSSGWVNARHALERLIWLLGLSDAERAFVDDAATHSLEGSAADAYETLLVFADWLEDARRSHHAERVRRLVPETGDVLVVTYSNLFGIRTKDSARECLDAIRSRLGKVGRDVTAVALPEGWNLQSLSWADMQVAGLVRLSQLAEERAAWQIERGHLLASIAEEAKRVDSLRSDVHSLQDEVDALREESEELKRENARLLRERRESGRPA